MAELRPFKTYTGIQKQGALARKVVTRLHKHEVSSLSADK